MNSKYAMALVACVGLIVTACGKSSSNNNGAPQLTTQDKANTTCMQQSTQNLTAAQQRTCQQQWEQVNQTDTTPYGNNQSTFWTNGNGNNVNNNGNWNQSNYNGNNYHGNNGFAGAAGFCDCPWGKRPTYINGFLRCVSSTTHHNSVAVAQVTFDFYNDNGHVDTESSAHFSLTDVTETNEVTTDPHGNQCYQRPEVGCIPGHANTCPVVNHNGYQVQTSCVPVANQNYGQCVRQEIIR